MRPVFQTVVDPDRGDCWRCCIASILELDAEDVPHFLDHRAPGGYPDPSAALAAWLERCSFTYVEVRSNGAQPQDLLNWGRARGVYAVASVPSQMYEGRTHAVVVTFADGPREGEVHVEVAHDPNPGNRPYDLATTRINALAFIVPIVPRAG